MKTKLEKASDEIMDGVIVYLRYFLERGDHPKKAYKNTRDAMTILFDRAMKEKI